MRRVCLRFFLSALPKWSVDMSCWCLAGVVCLVSFVCVSDVCAGRLCWCERIVSIPATREVPARHVSVLVRVSRWFPGSGAVPRGGGVGASWNATMFGPELRALPSSRGSG